MTALDTQIAGNHYTKMRMQPVTFIHANNIPFCEASIIKYVSRWRDKGGVTDLKKAAHLVSIIIQLEFNNDNFLKKSKRWCFSMFGPIPTIMPEVYIRENSIDFAEGVIITDITMWRHLNKTKDDLIELETYILDMIHFESWKESLKH